MRFWFEHSGDVPLRDQVVVQVTLGILCGELAPGERLPSIRELARRFGLHANTVSAGYRQLEAEGSVESRKGSGVYVKAKRPAARSPEAAAERLVANLFEGGKRLGIAEADLVARVQAWPTRAAATAVLLIEPDEELRRIVVAELSEALGYTVQSCGFGQCAELAAGTIVAVLPSKLEQVRAEVAQSSQPGARVVGLKVRSVPASLAERLPRAGAAGMLVGVASCWPDFLRFGRTMLVAAGVEGDALLVRDAREPGWRAGLEETAAVLCDSLTARELSTINTVIFRVLADDAAEMLR